MENRVLKGVDIHVSILQNNIHMAVAVNGVFPSSVIQKVGQTILGVVWNGVQETNFMYVKTGEVISENVSACVRNTVGIRDDDIIKVVVNYIAILVHTIQRDGVEGLLGIPVSKRNGIKEVGENGVTRTINISLEVFEALAVKV